MADFREYIHHNHFVAYYIFAALIFVPVLRIFYRARLPVWYSAFLFVPMIGAVICSVILALRSWPAAKLKAQGDKL